MSKRETPSQNAARQQLNTYVPAHQLRLRSDTGYLYVKWWSGNDTNYAHFHETDPGTFRVHAIGRNGTTVADKGDASLDDLPEGLVDTLRARYTLTEGTA